MIQTPEELKEFILKALDDKKAEDIAVIDLTGKTELAKYMIFATGRSVKNISAIADYIATEVKHNSSIKTVIEGMGGSGWVLMDAGDVITHLFNQESRQHLRLEEFWKR